MKKFIFYSLVWVICVSGIGLIGFQYRLFRIEYNNVKEKAHLQLADVVKADILPLLKRATEITSDINTSQISAKEIKQLINTAFLKSGIHQPFIFGFANPEDNSISYISDSAYLSKLIFSNYQFQFQINSNSNLHLFPNNSQCRFTIFFPQEKSYIYSQFNNYIYTLILFLTMVLISFIFSLKHIITKRKLAKIEYDFVNNMSHEMKTPISTIALAAGALKDTSMPHSKETIKNYINIIYSENERLQIIVNEILKQAKIERTKRKRPHEEVHMHSIIERCTKEAKIALYNKGGEIELSLQAQNPILYSDTIHMTHMISNIIGNAIKYSPEKPYIQIMTSDSKKNMEIRIKDNGIGISKKNHKKIFKKFFRVSNDVHNTKGFGLGLNYVKYVMKLHKGKIKVKSQLNKGTTFILTLKRY